MKKTLAAALLLAALLLLSGCGQQAPAPKPLSLEAAYARMAQAVTLPPMLEVDGEMALDFYGIEPGWCVQAVMMLAEDSLIADEILLLEARDQATADAMAALLKNRMDAKAAEAITYSPEQYAIIQRGHLVREGLHLALIVSPDADALLEAYRAAVFPGK